MTAIPHPPAAGLLSERLLAPLRQVARRQWMVLAARAGLQTALTVLAALLPAALLFGFLPELPAALRVALVLVLWLGLIAAAVRFFRPALRKRHLAHAALVVERRLDLQERLSSAVELSEEIDPRFAGSPELLAHLVRQAEQDAAAVNPVAVVPAQPVIRRWSLPLAPLVVAWVCLLILWPRPVLRGLYFTLMPWRSVPALLADVAVTPGDVRVASGDPIDFTATVGGSSSQAVTAKLVTRSAAGQQTDHALQATGPRAFALHMENVRKGFAYRVRSGEGDSPWYRVTVIPRPTVTSLDVHYDYPAYAGLAPVDQKNTDGAIAGVVGTHATLTVHASAPIDTAKSRLLVNEGRRDELTEPLTLVPGTTSGYEAKIRVRNSGQYRIHLVSAEGTSNPDDLPHPITAIDDREPSVAIVEPAESEVKVRPDDAVPVRFVASDDFAVVRVEAVVQVDDRPEQATVVDLSKFADRRHVSGEHRLTLPALLKQASVSPDKARKVTYWFRATDSRDPDPQTRESAHHTLLIDRSLNEPFALRDVRERQKDLQEAIRQAIDRLNQAEPQANDLRNAGRDRDEDENWVHDARDRADKATDLLATTSRDLIRVADENLNSGFDAVASSAKDIAAGPIQESADQMGRAALGVGRREARSKPAGEAQKQIVDARKRLEELLKKVDAAAAQNEAAALVRGVAEKQQELADAVEQSPPPPNAEEPNNAELTDAERQLQQELIGRLEQAVARSEALRLSEAVKAAQKLAELTDKVQRARQQQDQIGKRTDRQAEAVAAQERANEMARRQAELNRQVRDFALADQPNLRRADAATPDPNQLAEIVRELQQGNPDRAADLQRESAKQLKDTAERLRKFAGRDDAVPTDAQRVAQDAARQAGQRAEEAANRAKQAGEQLRQAAEGDNAGQKSEAAKRAAEAAKAVARQAEQTAADAEATAQGAIAAGRAAEADQKAAERSIEVENDAAAREAARAASQTAQATAKKASDARLAAEAAVQSARKAREAAQNAEQAAKQGETERAAEQLAHAGEALHDTQEHNEAAAKDFAVAEQQVAAADAADRAAALAEKQEALAGVTQPVADALTKARQDLPGPDDLGNQSKQIGQEAQQAAQLADQLGQMANAQHAAELADRAEAAEGSLKGAAETARRTAEAEKRLAAQQQAAKSAQEKAAQAENAAREAARQSAEAKRQAAVLREQAKAAERAGNANGAKEMNKQVAQADERAARAARQAEQSQQQASAAADKADAAAKAAESAQAEAGEAQGKTGQALAEALQMLRGVQEEVAAAGENGEGEANADAAKGEGGKRAKASGKSSSTSGKGNGQNQPTAPASAKEAMAQAARQVQEGLAAQRQAMQNMPMAARQAAKAINEAAQSMAAAQAGAAAEGSSQARGQATAQGQAGDAAPRGQPGQTADSKRGVALGGGGPDAPAAPASVQALGVSSDDWAKLPPQLQRDLLNAAQQSGPPAYREMIKNYYVRIARLPQAGQAAPGGK